MFGVAILGYGVVGSGVAGVLTENGARITKNAGAEIPLKYILDVRDFTDSPFSPLFTRDFENIISDDDIRVVVETIGGVGAAYEFTKRSLLAGKSVVTSNKELVATHGRELISLAAAHGVNYLFEASVCGGVPILRPITQCLAANEITEIFGILNGTTNYILTAMSRDKSGSVSFASALQEAQRLGYAESNPECDVEGIDACRKICILSDLAFGRHVSPMWVKTRGITGVSAEDTAFGSELGYTIKLIGRAVKRADGRISAYVAPHMLSNELLLSRVNGVMNGVVVRGNAIGDVMFYGAGAGKMPTASAVVADVIDAVKHDRARKLITWDEGDEAMMFPSEGIPSRWYLRARCEQTQLERRLGPLRSAVYANGETACVTERELTETELQALPEDFFSKYRLQD